ncbi:MAG: adenylate/guanylate cyclase domain-containing response regulator [Halieaceae bacterium]|nr:adenylate/guanylate cyclase domain-containing response regulator [Halieaceae bacterium]
MTTSSSQSTTLWSDLLLRAMAELRELYNPLEDQLADSQREDFAHLFDGSAKLDEMLQQSAPNRHDLMNVLSAIRGYAEMLREDLATEHAELDSALTRLLKGIQAANSGGDTSEPASATQRTITTEPGFILAVDDLQENRELVARYLSRSGHIVVTAAGGEEALRSLDQADVDVVLLDLVMPDMDGREVLRRIKEHPEWRATPVIIISGRQDMDGIIECIEAGADDYLFKPFNPVLLQARIKAGIERKRWHDREQLYRQQLERNEKFIRATFGRYLSDEIVTDILERPEGLELGGDLRRVTIMMSDIRGFTSLSEQLEPAQVVSLINRYLAAMTDIIMAYHGTIDEFIGDAILAVFGAPQYRDDDADRATQCALEMQAAMEEINRLNREDGLPEITTGIALNTGDVIAGNIGSERRSKYGFVGHAMNVTSRIEDVTAGGEILIADSTLQSLNNQYRTGDSRELKVKGIDELLQVHQILESDR